jgi:hypothetical protein
MMNNYRDFEYLLELTEEVDYFDVILKIQSDLREIFSYNSNTKTIRLVIISNRTCFDKEERLQNTSLYKKFKDKFEWADYVYTYHVLMNMLKTHEEYKEEGYHYDYIDLFDYDKQKSNKYTFDEIKALIDEKKDEFETLFVNEIKFTDKELEFIDKLSKHPLLEGKIKGFKWIEKRYSD